MVVAPSGVLGSWKKGQNPVAFDEVKFGLETVPAGMLKSFLDDGFEFKLFDMRVDLNSTAGSDYYELNFLTFNEHPLAPALLPQRSGELLGSLINDNGFIDIKQEGNLPGISVKPVIDLNLWAGVEVKAPQIGSIDAFSYYPSYQISHQDFMSSSSILNFGVSGVTTPFQLSGKGISNLEGFAGIATKVDAFGIEELRFEYDGDIASLNKDYFDDIYFDGIGVWPHFVSSPENSGYKKIGVSVGGQVAAEKDWIDKGPLSLSSEFQSGQAFFADPGEVGRISDSILSLDLSLLDLLSIKFPPLALLSNDLVFSGDAGPLGVKLEYKDTIIDYDFSLSLQLVQEFSFEPVYNFTYKFNDAYSSVTLSGGVGELVSYALSEDYKENILDVEVDVAIEGVFKNSYSLVPVLSGVPKLLDFNLDAELSLWRFSKKFSDGWSFLDDTNVGSNLKDFLSFDLQLGDGFSLGSLVSQHDLQLENAFSIGFELGESLDLHWLSGPMSFADIIDEGHVTSEDDFSTLFQSMFGLSVDNLTYTGSLDAAFLTDNFTIKGAGFPDFVHGSGLLLSSGGFPGPQNSEPFFTVNHNTPGDPDLTRTAQDAFSDAGETYDAAVIEFTINVTDPMVTGLRAELVFGSEEFPVYINSSYVDIAALYVNGVNHALFNNNPNRPLSVISQNVEGGYILNNNNGNGPLGDYNEWAGSDAPYGIEWNGFSALLSVRAPLQLGENIIKIGVADTGDSSLDSGLFISNLQLIGGGGGGTGVLSILDGTNSPSVTPTTLTEEVLIGSAPTTIFGTPQTLNNDIIVGFKSTDALVFNGYQFSLDQMKISAGSAILEIDTNGDTEFDTTITLAGVSHESDFDVSIVDGNTVITYIDPEDSVDVSGVVVGRAGEGLVGTTVIFSPAEGTAMQAGTDDDGNFSFSLSAGAFGRLDATREYNSATDGNITARDALDVLRLAVGLAPSWGPASPLDFIAADINQDGQVTAADALDVLRAAVGLQSANQPRWIFLDADADLEGINRNNTTIESGIVIDPLMAGLTEVSMTGVLLGSMQEYA